MSKTDLSFIFDACTRKPHNMYKGMDYSGRRIECVVVCHISTINLYIQGDLIFFLFKEQKNLLNA